MENNLPLRSLLSIANSLDTHVEHRLAYRRAEAARLMGVTEKTLSNWEQAGYIRAVRVGSGKRVAVLYPVDELKRVLHLAPEKKGIE